MTQFPSATTTRLESLKSRKSLPLLADFFVLAAETVVKWEQRSRSRRHLRELSPHHLRDIGLTPDMVDLEVRKLFWQV
ncbi:DUF1127 domain-containing protein [Aliiruegeria lutimaris]|uniref:Uncharacterized conserved protein YjiS, DUF1127 family n=1 Tax=Aliiruegeria lutimaris TaxID=571298 RepID=A0A1G8Z9N1_9RHOB|nr:DUF1127 domain-containing protein [Aliiruegeria lutimaris]SDK11364.1 Uncharacterized conserved protein YjiS, DUF1127 family [Aliiruegeria lutimaris]